MFKEILFTQSFNKRVLLWRLLQKSEVTYVAFDGYFCKCILSSACKQSKLKITVLIKDPVSLYVVQLNFDNHTFSCLSSVRLNIFLMLKWVPTAETNVNKGKIKEYMMESEIFEILKFDLIFVEFASDFSVKLIYYMEECNSATGSRWYMY